MLIGIDDTDSNEGMCTTYIAAILYRKLKATKYPRLIRLNPNIPYKTRGNGAVAIETKEGKIDTVKTTLKLIEKYAKLEDPKTNPGVAFIENPTTRDLKTMNKFYLKTVSELVTKKEAQEIAKKVGAETYEFNNGRGIIGALAAVGAKLSDKTYELIAYRPEKNYGKKRMLDEDTVHTMNELTYPQTFDNIDPHTKQILITPRGYDPIFCGIRGESPKAVEGAWNLITPLEEIEFTQIFETNQATDAHIRTKKISEINPYDCVKTEACVVENPHTIEGGHVLFKIDDGSSDITCAAYKPTGDFRRTVSKLMQGDIIRAYGGVGRYSNTINLEKMEVIELNKKYVWFPPSCCGRSMTSAGKNKGFKCKKCGRRVPLESRIKKEIERDLTLRFYEVPPRARRHLSKPLIRFVGK